MPRALVVCEHATLNGGERSLLAVLPHLQQAGWHFDFLAPPEGPLAEELRALRINIVAGEGRCAARLAQELETNRYDLVHANSLAMSIEAGDVPNAHGVPSIGHLRDIQKLSRAKLTALGLRTRLLAVSGAVNAAYSDPPIEADQLHVLYNGVDLNVFHPLTRKAPIIPWREHVIGIVGQIILRKGQDTALSAIVPLLRSDASRHVVVVGARHSEKLETIEYERKLHAIVNEAGLAHRVRFLGTCDDMPQRLQSFSLLLHTARQEPLGRVLLEAAASGLPVVATDVGGTREIFPAAENDGALLAPPDDVDAATEACRRVLRDPFFAYRLGTAGRRRMEAAFSVETAAAGLLRHYREVSGVG